MIKFDVEKLRSVYVYINRVTDNFVFVTSHRNGQEYTPKGSIPDRYNDRAVNKIRIEKDIATKYRSINKTVIFDTPRLASLNYYDGNIVGIELQPYSLRAAGLFQKAENWKSAFAHAAAELRNLIDAGLVVNPQFNGDDIYWHEGSGLDRTEFILDKESGSHFSIVATKFLQIDRLGVGNFRKFNEAIAALLHEQSDDSDDSDIAVSNLISERSKLKINDGICLRYSPCEGVVAHSPVIPWSFTSGSRDHSSAAQLRGIYKICDNVDPVYLTLDFVHRAAEIISRIYGHEAVDNLEVPRILSEVGVVNFNMIEEASRKTYPVDLDVKSVMSWMLGLMYREADLSKLKQLSRVIKRAITTGIINTSSVDGVFKEGFTNQSIEMRSARDASKDAVNRKQNIFINLKRLEKEEEKNNKQAEEPSSDALVSETSIEENCDSEISSETPINQEQESNSANSGWSF